MLTLRPDHEKWMQVEARYPRLYAHAWTLCTHLRLWLHRNDQDKLAVSVLHRVVPTMDRRTVTRLIEPLKECGVIRVEDGHVMLDGV